MDDSMDDLFDSLLNLESTFYEQGYAEGFADGLRAGTSEGKQFGLQTGFRRFLSAGILQGRCEIWSSTAPDDAAPARERTRQSQHKQQRASDNDNENETDLTPLSGGRASRQLRILQDLVIDVPTQNDEAAVDEFENRMKRARARAKVVQRLMRDTVPVQLEDDVVRVLAKGEADETIESATPQLAATARSSRYDHSEHADLRAQMEIEIT
ncbi:uncharacterized protein V1518DRAFT_194236 [Limtongia smithiae]|uniref:uncharacterized protein n=1 Tax=Limtongia smithiae TaxID=1125753 RepID=UPI0034CFD0F9